VGKSTVEIGAANFKDAIGKPGILFLDFWAEWCGPCRAFGPIFEDVASRHPDAVFGKVDTEKEQALAAAFQIRSIPTLMAFRDGVLLLSQPGMLPGDVLEDLVTRIKALDMAQVKKEIERRLAEGEASEGSAGKA